MRNVAVAGFEELPEVVPDLAWPTLGRGLFHDLGRYVARTRANPDYGKPGWTRDCGKRFHRGVDIAPVHARETGRMTTVLFSDCETGREYPSEERTWIPEDEVFAVLPGRVIECNSDESKSDLGLYVVLQHGPERLFTLYGHLAALNVESGMDVRAGALLGQMGQTSKNADARNWMAIAPHLHFEVITNFGGAHDPLEFLLRGLTKTGRCRHQPK